MDPVTPVPSRPARPTFAELFVTFALVIFRDLTEGIVVGVALGAILFIDRMPMNVGLETHAVLAVDGVADAESGDRVVCDPQAENKAEAVVYRLTGAFFFEAASTVGAVPDRIADRRSNFVLDFATVPFLDSTAANVIEDAIRKANRAGIRVSISGANPGVARMLYTHGV